jgi:hypothetical protein
MMRCLVRNHSAIPRTHGATRSRGSLLRNDPVDEGTDLGCESESNIAGVSLQGVRVVQCYKLWFGSFHRPCSLGTADALPASRTACSITVDAAFNVHLVATIGSSIDIQGVFSIGKVIRVRAIGGCASEQRNDNGITPLRRFPTQL